jgi:hypothetical protein
MRTRKHLQVITAALGASALGASGCTYDEGLNIHDLTGTVVVSRDAVTRTIDLTDPNTGIVTTESVTDLRLLGPVYIGLFASVRDNLERYPHPERGPAFGVDAAAAGDTYPYGGTTMGDLRYSCLEAFSCRFVSGRYTSYQSMIDWFSSVLGDVPEDSGRPVSSGEQLRQICMELYEVNSDNELRMVEDRDLDGTIDEADLDFIENADGDFEGRFEILDADFYAGMSAWAFADNPGAAGYRIDTCTDQNGYFETTYDRRFRSGLQQPDVLNFPANYIREGDFVASEGFIWDDPEAEATIVIDFAVPPAGGN